MALTVQSGCTRSPGGPIEPRGADRYTLRDGKVSEGVAHFDPRPLLERQKR
jgi:hypothetical protein